VLSANLGSTKKAVCMQELCYEVSFYLYDNWGLMFYFWWQNMKFSKHAHLQDQRSGFVSVAYRHTIKKITVPHIKLVAGFSLHGPGFGSGTIQCNNCGW
jgi:hypothetical protein